LVNNELKIKGLALNRKWTAVKVLNTVDNLLAQVEGD
jgi:hypothetical protein